MLPLQPHLPLVYAPRCGYIVADCQHFWQSEHVPRCRPRAAQRKNSIEKLQKRWRRRVAVAACHCNALHLPNIRQLASFIVIVKCPIRRRRMSPYSTPRCKWTPSRTLMKLLIMRRMLYFSQFGCQPLSSDTLYVTCWPSAQREREKETKRGRDLELKIKALISSLSWQLAHHLSVWQACQSWPGLKDDCSVFEY